MKKLSGLLVTSVLATSLLGVNAASAKSIDSYIPEDMSGHWAESVLDDMVSSDYISGYVSSDGTYEVRPNQTITRAEFTAILVRILDLKTDGPGITFTDVGNKWYKEPIRIASELGLIGGVGDGKFAPDAKITRGEMAALLSRAFKDTVAFSNSEKAFSDVPEYWAKKSIIDASKMGLIGGYSDGTFKPKKNATRAEAASMLQRGIQKETGSLPNESALANIVKEHVTESFEIFNTKNIEQLDEYANKYTTGFYEQATIEGNEVLKEILDAGIDLELKDLDGVVNAAVTNKSNRFAEVELSGTNYSITMTDEGEVEVDDNDGVGYDMNGTYYLKKMSDGSWKIYNYLFAE